MLAPESWRPDRVGVMVDLVRIAGDRPAWQVTRVDSRGEPEAAAEVVELLLATRLPVSLGGQIISAEDDWSVYIDALAVVLAGIGVGASDRADTIQ
jgi:hypothetical protein